MNIQYTLEPMGTDASGAPLYRVQALGQERVVRVPEGATVDLAVAGALTDIAEAALRFPRETMELLEPEAELIRHHRRQVWHFLRNAERYPTEADMVAGLEAELGPLLTRPERVLGFYAQALCDKGLIPEPTYAALRAGVLEHGEGLLARL